MITENFKIEKYHATIVSWKSGVSPRSVCKWRIVRVSDNRVIETNIETRKMARWILRGIPQATEKETTK